MATEVRSRTGCWTCRSRRKKCDESYPTCFQCSKRGLTCSGYGEKPPGFNRGPKEKVKTTSPRWCIVDPAQDKKAPRATGDRSRTSSHPNLRSPRSPRVKALDTHAIPLDHMQDGSAINSRHDQMHDAATSETTVPDRLQYSLWDDEYKIQSLHDPNLEKNESISHSIEHHLATDTHSEHEVCKANPPLANEQIRDLSHVSLNKMAQFPSLPSSIGLDDAHLFVYYLEEVYPWQFRYNPGPPLSKDYLLRLVLQNRPLYLAVLALSSSHMSIFNPQKAAKSLKTSEDDLINHYDAAIKEVQQSLQQYHFEQQNGSDSDHQYILVCIIMLLFLNILHDGRFDWCTHLQAAVSLIGVSCTTFDEPDNYTLLNTSPFTAGISPGQSHQGLDTTGPVAGIIMWFQILSNLATANKTMAISPALRERYIGLLQYPSSGINLENITGCQNWVLSHILSVYALRDWKRQAGVTNSLSMWDLTQRAGDIRHRLESGINHLLRIFPQHPHHPAPGPSAQQEKWQVTYVYALATRVLLEVVVSGAYPDLKEVERAVVETKNALQNLADSSLLQFLTWPLCIAGCMAKPEHYDAFNELCRSVSTSKVGDAPKVERVIQRCWWIRQTYRDGHGSDWDDALESLEMGVLFF